MEPTTSTTTARDELAKTATSAFYDSGTNLHLMTAVLRLAWFRVADAILAAGYRKPRTICYVILDGDASPQARYATKADAEEVRDSWIAAHESAGVPHNFRVAEIVESA